MKTKEYKNLLTNLEFLKNLNENQRKHIYSLMLKNIYDVNVEELLKIGNQNK